MNLFLIENDQTVDKFLNSSIYKRGRDIIICFNYLVNLRLIREGEKHLFYFVEDLLTADDYNKLHFVSDQFAFNWYRLNGLDFTMFQGISFGETVKITLSRDYMLTILLKYGEVIRKAVERWPEAKNIYFDFSNSHNSFHFVRDDEGKFFNKRRLVEDVSRQLKLKVFLLEPNFFIPSACIVLKHRKEYKTLMDKLKYFLKFCANKISTVLVFLSKPQKAIYFYSYFNINSMINYMSGRFIIDNFDIKMVFNSKKIFAFRCLDFNDLCYNLNEKEKLFLESLKQKIADNSFGSYIDSYFIFNGISYANIYSPVFQDLILNVIPHLLKHSGKVKKAIRKYGINKIIVNEELGAEIQVLLAVCKQEAVESVWVDHGMQSFNHKQRVCDRNKSDLVVCSGPFYADYYRSQGNSGRRCVVLGNPSLDLYPSSKAKKASAIKNVLFLGFDDNFYARLDRFAYQEKYYQEIFSIFNDLLSLGVKINFKPRIEFNKKYFEYLFDFFRIDVTKINYIEGVPFSEVVFDMDLIVSNVSNCFYESLAAGVPVVFFEPVFIPDSLLPPLNGIIGEEVIRISKGRELLRIIEANQDKPEYLNKFLDNFIQKHSERYMGKLDGMSGRRIVEFLSQ